jgi:hypothetical protein
VNRRRPRRGIPRLLQGFFLGRCLPSAEVPADAYLARYMLPSRPSLQVLAVNAPSVLQFASSRGPGRAQKLGSFRKNVATQNGVTILVDELDPGFSRVTSFVSAREVELPPLRHSRR